MDIELQFRIDLNISLNYHKNFLFNPFSHLLAAGCNFLEFRKFKIHEILFKLSRWNEIRDFNLVYIYVYPSNNE